MYSKENEKTYFLIMESRNFIFWDEEWVAAAHPLTYITTPFGHPKAMFKTELLTFPALPPNEFHPQSSPYNSIQTDGAQAKNLKTTLDSYFSLNSTSNPSVNPTG